MGVVLSTPAGRALAKSSEMKSARSAAISNIALYIRCCITAWRRMSTMNAMRGRMAAM
jgi:hypothetical protein